MDKSAPKEMLQFAVKNCNKIFLKMAFRDPDAILEAAIIDYEDIRSELLDQLEDNTNIELILNIFMRADFAMWTQDDAERLLGFIETFCDAEAEPSLVYYCYNPMLTICIASELALNIGGAIGALS